MSNTVSIDMMCNIIKHSDLNNEYNFEKLVEMFSKQNEYNLNKKMCYDIYN